MRLLGTNAKWQLSCLEYIIPFFFFFSFSFLFYIYIYILLYIYIYIIESSFNPFSGTKALF